jgi:hypothetical protein
MFGQAARRSAIGATVALAAAAMAFALDASPAGAAQACGGQGRIEVVPSGGTFSCEASTALPRGGATQFTASAVISSNGKTVSVTASGAPDGSTLFVASHRGISGPAKVGEAVFVGGTASVTVELQCGQVDVKALPAGSSSNQSEWRIVGPFITNENDCGAAPTTTAASTTTAAPTSTAAPSSTAATTSVPPSSTAAPSPGAPTAGPSTSAAVLAETVSSTPGAAASELPHPGSSAPSLALLLSLAAVVAGGVLVVAGRRFGRDELPE